MNTQFKFQILFSLLLVQEHLHLHNKNVCNYVFFFVFLYLHSPACLFDNSSWNLHLLLSVCLPTCLPVHMPVSFVCLSPRWAATGIIYPPEHQVLLPLRWKANENWAVRLFPWLSNRGDAGWHTLSLSTFQHIVKQSTVLGECQFKHTLMETQTFGPIFVFDPSHRLKIIIIMFVVLYSLYAFISVQSLVVSILFIFRKFSFAIWRK